MIWNMGYDTGIDTVMVWDMVTIQCSALYLSHIECHPHPHLKITSAGMGVDFRK